MSETVVQFLKELAVDEGQTWQRMTIFPVQRNGSGACRYKVLGQALADGDVTIGEKQEASVPELILANRGDLPVFILDGEEVVGGKQNRLANASMLVDAHTAAVLPVSCVEQGRWHATAPAFAAGEASFPTLRRHKAAQVHQALRLDEGHVTDQAAIWQEIADRTRQAGASAPTSAMHDIYRRRAVSLGDYARAFPRVAGAVGLVAAIGGHIACADVFDQSSTASALWDKLIRSYAMDALDESTAPSPVSTARARRFLVRAAAARFEEYPSVALGKDVRIAGRRFIGSALMYQDTVVHLALFRVEQPPAGDESGVAQASIRRGYHVSHFSRGDTASE